MVTGLTHGHGIVGRGGWRVRLAGGGEGGEGVVGRAKRQGDGLFHRLELLTFAVTISFSRSFVYLSNLVYGVPLEQSVPIVSESGDIQGHLDISIKQCTGRALGKTDWHLNVFLQVIQQHADQCL